MAKRYIVDSAQITRRVEDLVGKASNRYRITVQVANRAKLRRYEEIDDYDDHAMKPILRAIIEMSDEMTQPEILSD
ncbi:DNA-directed RNA polymerase subunit omega [Tumidithrix helvetica PCC 7403]|uniref:DNA-directed RNA polymerase subunit omega n=1 Tax=Tumidithrix elongata BACA0141 TaxID=2716417 RepID=A0AAW9Q1J2_9CYAN|nr:DNA-directed RNA polymerase subunit omega [Tumidithrix elongata RA019]